MTPTDPLLPFDLAEELDEAYLRELARLQLELLKLQSDLNQTGRRLLILFEGRDAAGKGGAILRFTQNLNPRHYRVVALPKPTSREQGQWYFQRHLKRLPNAGEAVFFDRSWYNRRGRARVRLLRRRAARALPASGRPARDHARR